MMNCSKHPASKVKKTSYTRQSFIAKNVFYENKEWHNHDENLYRETFICDKGCVMIRNFKKECNACKCSYGAISKDNAIINN